MHKRVIIYLFLQQYSLSDLLMYIVNAYSKINSLLIGMNSYANIKESPYP